ncbi:sigma 54-interacting transcriptional regulator [uncultured Nitrospira sp.]|uniref:sigma 54-interacting transcriptional regulator n=1 Tax=uncultured Nitrospira sp. TaxID=157176 RepID=UPI00313FF891
MNNGKDNYIAEMRFRAVAQSSHDAIIIADQSGTILFWNKGAKDIFGYESEETVGQPLTMLMPDRYRLAHQAGLERYSTRGETRILGETVELSGLRSTGEEFPLELTLSAWEEKDRLFFSGIIRDISQRKEAEEALQQSEEKYRAIFNQAVEGIYQATPAGVFLNANAALSHLLGYDSPQILMEAVKDIGRHLYVEPTKREEFCRLLEQTDVITDFESEVYRADGTPIWISENARVIRNAEGAVQWYQGFLVDISGRKQAEELLERQNRLQAENRYLQEEVLEAGAFGDLVGQSPALHNVIRQIDLVAPTEATVLILGESGTGKELVAREIHKRSQRKDQPLIRVNCASIPRELFESEFFGHVKGAFTGAVKDREGRFGAADGGTLFLDEVGEIPLDLQGKFLRVLQEQQYERVGEERTRQVDVRVIAATNKNLKQEVETGGFRQDLYYRLSVFPLEMSPLRERKEDIPLLAEYLLGVTSKKLHCVQPRLTEASVGQLQRYNWPGNVRELQNVIERGLILSGQQGLSFDIPQPGEGRSSSQHRESKASAREWSVVTEQEMRRRERDNTLAALQESDWKIYGKGGAAERLGIKPTTLVARIKKMGIVKGR